MTSQCPVCGWNSVYLLRLEEKYDRILKLLASELELTESGLEELQMMMRVKP